MRFNEGALHEYALIHFNCSQLLIYLIYGNLSVSNAFHRDVIGATVAVVRDSLDQIS